MHHFSAVPDRNFTRPIVRKPMLSKQTEAKIVHLKTLRRLRHLKLKWEVPPMFAHAPLLRPDRLISNALGDEGEGSVLALLRKKHWALSLSAGMGGEGRDNPTYEISTTLTDKGQKAWHHVVKLIFEAIQRIRADGIPNYIFDQMKLKDTHSFQYQWRTSDAFNSAMGAAAAMVKESLTTFPRVSSIIQDFDAKACQALLRFLVPERMHVLSMGGIPPPKTFPRKEPYYGAQFAIEAIAGLQLQDWQGSGTNGEITLPKPNMYIPGVTPGSELHPSKINAKGPVFPELPHPHVLLNDTFGTLYHRQDDSFGDPWLAAVFRIRTHKKFVESMGAEALVMVSLFVSCAIEHIKTASYPFVTAGLSAGLSLGKGTEVWLSLSGMNPIKENWQGLLKLLLEPLSRQPLEAFASTQRFHTVLEAMKRGLHNQLKAGPSAQASQRLWSAMTNQNPPLADVIAAAESATYGKLAAFLPKLFQEVSCEAFWYGQISPEDAKDAWKLVKDTFTVNSKPLARESVFHSMARALPTTALDGGKAAPYVVPVAGKSKSGNSTMLLMDFGWLDCREKVAMGILFKVLPNKFFEELRTKQQTGYVASASMTGMQRRSAALFTVVSAWCAPGDLLGRFEAFIESISLGFTKPSSPKAKVILTEKTFEMVRNSMLASFRKPIQTIAEMSSMLQNIVMNFDGDFQVELKQRTILQTITLAEVKAVVQKVFHLGNKRRIAVLYAPEGVKHGLHVAPKSYTQIDEATLTQHYHNKAASEKGYGEFVKRPAYECNVPVHNKATSLTDMLDEINLDA